jgi:hypothetical protein
MKTQQLHWPRISTCTLHTKRIDSAAQKYKQRDLNIQMNSEKKNEKQKRNNRIERAAFLRRQMAMKGDNPIKILVLKLKLVMTFLTMHYFVLDIETSVFL